MSCTLEIALERISLRELVLRAQTGDRDAFGELFRRYERVVYATAFRRLRNDAEAQELSQEVFVQALRKLHQLRQPESFGSWLRSMTTRMAINRAVRRGPVINAEPATMDRACIETETPLRRASVYHMCRVKPGISEAIALQSTDSTFPSFWCPRAQI